MATTQYDFNTENWKRCKCACDLYDIIFDVEHMIWSGGAPLHGSGNIFRTLLAEAGDARID